MPAKYASPVYLPCTRAKCQTLLCYSGMIDAAIALAADLAAAAVALADCCFRRCKPCCRPSHAVLALVCWGMHDSIPYTCIPSAGIPSAGQTLTVAAATAIAAHAVAAADAGRRTPSMLTLPILRYRVCPCSSMLMLWYAHARVWAYSSMGMLGHPQHARVYAHARVCP